MANDSIVPKHMQGLMVLEEKNVSAGKSIFTTSQLQRLFKPTPKEHIRQLTKDGKTFNYVEGGYIRRQLDVLFGFDWDFEVVSIERVDDFIVCQGKLTGRTEDSRSIVKMQFGGAAIKYKKKLVNGKRVPLDIGNDYKAAATDALKKCAAEFGIARDVYYANEFVEAKIIEADIEQEAKEEAEDQELKKLTQAMSDDEKNAILADLNSLDVNSKIRSIKAATGKITLPKKLDELTDMQWRSLRLEISGPDS